jgi:putative ABC transport system ATP-binding protein
MALIEVQGLTRRFGALAALDNVSLTIEAGEWVAITGPSGSGKTTLLNILAGLDRPTSGRARVDEVDLGMLGARDQALYRRRSVGLVFQQFHLVQYLTALENVMLAQYIHSVADRGEAQEALSVVGLAARLSHLPSELSGGEQQRVCIARALINHPKIVLADEPTGNLDGVNEAVVMSLLAGLHRQGHTLVLVTHDPAIAARAGREIRLEHGRLVAPETPETVEHQVLLADLWRALEEDSDRVPVEQRGIADLLAEGLLHFADGRIAFTETGRLHAAEVVRRRRLGEALAAHTLAREIQVACGRDEPIAAAVTDQVCAFLEHPLVCPHGRAIPAGPACCPAKRT